MKLTDAMDAKRMLVALLHNPLDQPVDGIEQLSMGQKTFLITTCAARMIEEAICANAQYDAATAKEGLARLIEGMHDHIDQICGDVHNADALRARLS